MVNYTNKSFCRLCDSPDLSQVLKLEATPPANSFVEISASSEEQIKIPLEAVFCENCYHVQLLQIVDPIYLFKEYLYVSGTSSIFLKHFSDYVSDIENWVDEKGLIIDIGSNDGSLLKFFQKKNWTALGIDPAENLCKIANAENIETINNFFTKKQH